MPFIHITFFNMSYSTFYVENLKIFINMQDKEIKTKAKTIRQYANIIMEQNTKIWNLEDKINELNLEIEKLKNSNK